MFDTKILLDKNYFQTPKAQMFGECKIPMAWIGYSFITDMLVLFPYSV